MAKAFFSDDAARRIVSATIKVEGMPLDHGAITSRYRGGDDADRAFVLSKTTAKWTLGSSQELDAYEGAAGSEAIASPTRKVKAWNKLVDVPSGVWVLLGLAHAAPDGKDVWYLVTFPPSKVEVVTDIQCVAGKMEVTKKFFWLIPYETTP